MIRRIATVLLSLALLTGCDSSPHSQPTTSSRNPPGSTTATTKVPNLAPPVKNPVDAAAYVAAPCSSLTDAQLAGFGFAKGNVDANKPGETCNFGKIDKTKAEVIAEVTFFSGGGGLDSLYTRQQQRNLYREWEPSNLVGYPTVRYRVSQGDLFQCETAVGIADSTYFNVRYYYWRGSPGPDACGESHKVASAVLATVRVR